VIDAPLPAHLEAFLNAQRLARLATVDEHSQPHVVPVCFAYNAGVVYIALDAKPKRVPVHELRRVRNLIANPAVQLLVDVWDEDWTRLAYLQLRGVASVIEPGDEQAAALRLLRARYAQYVAMPLEDAPVIRIAVASYNAWGAI
jgi:coenzyme F420-0:L-glutamate ligase/coenzyme F420-1:gamma-L-glutamate ligase